jgi:hypothetical protein
MLNFFVARIIRTKNMQATNITTFYNVIASGGAKSLEQEGGYIQKWEKGVIQSNSAWE